MNVSYGTIREKSLAPRRAPRRSLLPISSKRTQIRLKSLLYLSFECTQKVFDSLEANPSPDRGEDKLQLVKQS